MHSFGQKVLWGVPFRFDNFFYKNSNAALHPRFFVEFVDNIIQNMYTKNGGSVQIFVEVKLDHISSLLNLSHNSKHQFLKNPNLLLHSPVL